MNKIRELATEQARTIVYRWIESIDSSSLMIERVGDLKESIAHALEQAMSVSGYTKEPEIEHGQNCPKAIHDGFGFLHPAYSDEPYVVDGVRHCGRCHRNLGGGL